MTMRASRGAITALGLALAVTIAGASYAQQRAPQPTPLPAPPQANRVVPQPNAGQDRQFDRQFDQQFDRRGGRADRGGLADRGGRGDRLERRLDFLHYELRISQQQQRLWDVFADAMREEAQNIRGRLAARNDGGRRGGAPGGGAESAIERLELRQDRLAERGERVAHLLGTLRPLYTALNAEQKRTADRLLFQAGGRANRGGLGRGGFGRGGFGRGGFNRGQERGLRDERDNRDFGPDYR